MVKSRIPPGIEREHVLQAIQDYLGGAPHDFGPSTKFDLFHDGQRLPPKAIVGLAAKRATGELLTPKDFKGGEASVCFHLLERLGFTLEPKPEAAAESELRPAPRDWSEAECYFAVWGYDQLDLDRGLQKRALYVELAELLGRTVKSVEFKIQNVSACDSRPRSEKPISEAPHKQALLQAVFDDYWSDRDAARSREPEMRELLKFPGSVARRAAGDGQPILIEEGAATQATTRTRVRSRQFVEEGRRHFRALDPEGRLRCAACGYVAPDGLPDGVEIIQLHHTQPLADADDGGHRIDLEAALAHLLPLCPTCHVLAHTARPPLHLDALRVLRRQG
jgi:hypothetical protein